ncbi:hypothetical protein FACS189499_09280 [Clostridia bacterium]|nr:hypothetical protein FACS189499_09280 [Clostridia bacterium]
MEKFRAVLRAVFGLAGVVFGIIYLTGDGDFLRGCFFLVAGVVIIVKSVFDLRRN